MRGQALRFRKVESRTASAASSLITATIMATNDAHANILTPSEAIPENAVHVKGPDLSNRIDLTSLLKAYETIGFQATGLARAIEVVDEMVSFALSPSIS